MNSSVMTPQTIMVTVIAVDMEPPAILTKRTKEHLGNSKKSVERGK